MTATRERPAPWALPPDGFHFEAVEQDGWVMPPVGAGRCRYGKPSCKKPAVATLMRSNGRGGTSPWDYCEEHMYSRWIEDGKVLGWRLVPDAVPLEEHTP